MRRVLVIILVVCIVLSSLNEGDCDPGRRRRSRLHGQKGPVINQLNKVIVEKSTWTEKENELKNDQGMKLLDSENGQEKGLGADLGAEQANEVDVAELEDERDIEQKTDDLDLTEQLQEADE